MYALRYGAQRSDCRSARPTRNPHPDTLLHHAPLTDRRLLLAMMLAVVVPACAAGPASSTTPTDVADGTDAGASGADSAGTDAGAGADAGTNGQDSAGFDAGPLSALGTTAAPPATIVTKGTSGLILRGIVLAPDGPLDPGEVLVIDNKIACVAKDCSKQAGAATATIVDTHGTISPGLIDCHNHMSYNFLGEWIPNPPKVFNNRYEWSDDPAYEKHISPYADNRSKSTHFCPASKWAELRSIVHGTTTMQGQPSAASACIDGWVRNANRYHGLGYDHMRGTIGSPRDITDSQAESIVASFKDPKEPTTRYHVHMCEGVSGDHIEEEFDSYAGRDPRKNRHNGTSLLAFSTTVLIHAVTLTDKQLDEAKKDNAMVVWSPSSNFALYGYGAGRTAPIAKLLALDIITGIGPDWTVSGEDELLSELRVCHEFGKKEKIAKLTNKKLWEMATIDGSVVVGLNGHVGQLVKGERADISVFARKASDPYATVLDSRAADVRLVLIDGKAYYGDQTLESLGRNAFCEELDACGTAKFICVSNGPTAPDRDSETMAAIQKQLFDILEGTGVEPYVEKYGRGKELQGLIDCSK